MEDEKKDESKKEKFKIKEKIVKFFVNQWNKLKTNSRLYEFFKKMKPFLFALVILIIIILIEWHISSNLFMEGVDKNPEAGIALFVGLLAVTVSTFSNYINNKETNKRLEKQLRYDKEIETLLKLKQILDEISDNIPSEDFMSMRNDPVHYNAGTHKLYEFEKGLNFYRLPKIVRDKIESMTYGYKTEDMMITSLWSISKINYNKYRYTENLRDLNRCVKTILDK